MLKIPISYLRSDKRISVLITIHKKANALVEDILGRTMADEFLELPGAT